MKKPLFLAVLSPRLVFAFSVFTIPLIASAGIVSFFSTLFSSDTESQPVSISNSQTITLLQAPASADPLFLARGGGDISIVNDSALLPESGPNGSMADVGVSNNQHGNISVYVVRKGDTLSQIAKMYGVTANTIAWQNDLRGGLIQEGQTLVILPISGVQHTVKKGDTVASIAKLYKADAEEIRDYNGFTEDAKLAVGDLVLVPDGEIASPTTSAASRSTLRGTSGPEYAGYYMRPIIGGRKSQGLHGYNGVDLATYHGAPVIAAAGGQVIVARAGGYNGGYGSYVVISHTNGTQTLYSHLSVVLVSVGESLVQGQIIGNVGSTGKSTGPHLHFEIRGAKNPF